MDEVRRVKATVAQLYGAMAERDADRFCALLTGRVKRLIIEVDLERRPGVSCKESSRRVLASTGYTKAAYRVLDVAVEDGRARARVTVADSTVTVSLVEADGRWKATSLGTVSEG